MPGRMRSRRSGLIAVLACAVAGVAAACASTPPRQPPGEPPASIGVATMETDGTIVLSLNATAPGGVSGHGYFRYPIGHQEYEAVLKHLGGLRPGESKPVPPWPDPPQ